MTSFDDCARVGELLPEHLAGRLPPEDERAVRAHLEGCADCRRRAEAVSLLQQTPVPQPDPDRWERFVDGVVSAADGPGRRRRWPWAVAAAAVVALAASVLILAPAPETSAGGLEAVAREVAELPEPQAAVWTAGVDPARLVPAAAAAADLSDEELRQLVREVERS